MQSALEEEYKAQELHSMGHLESVAQEESDSDEQECHEVPQHYSFSFQDHSAQDNQQARTHPQRRAHGRKDVHFLSGREKWPQLVCFKQ